MTDEQLEALRAMPVRLRAGLLPAVGPSAITIAELEAAGLVVLIDEQGPDARWALTTEGQREAARWTRR